MILVTLLYAIIICLQMANIDQKQIFSSGDDLVAGTETQLLALTETESPFGRADPGRKGLPDFLKVLRNYICLIFLSLQWGKINKNISLFHLELDPSFSLFLRSHCGSWSTVGLTAGIRRCLTASGETCAHGDPKHGESSMSSLVFKLGITACEMRGDEDKGH